MLRKGKHRQLQMTHGGFHFKGLGPDPRLTQLKPLIRIVGWRSQGRIRIFDVKGRQCGMR